MTSAGTGHRTTALITGASSGIGLELAKVFARHSHDVVLVARDERRLRQLAGELEGQFGVSAKVVACDLSVPDAAAALAESLRADGVLVDILVNNAGLIVYGEFAETSAEAERQMIQVNLVALTELTKRLLPAMRARGRGWVLNVASTGSFAPSPLNAVYSATKAYVLSFSVAIGNELRGTGVSVTALCPGATRTELQARGGMADVKLLERAVMSAAAVAEVGYRALMSGRRIVVAGLPNKLSVFMTRLLPQPLVARVARALLERPPSQRRRHPRSPD